MSNKCAVCYVTDINYLLPSIISATTLRRYIKPDDASVFIYVVDTDDAQVQAINKTLRPLAIELHHLDSTHYGDIDINKYKQSHVPLAAVGRFFLSDVLPEHFEHIVYIDGDTWIPSDPSALIKASIPEGKFAAAEDTLHLQQHNSCSGSAKKIRQYYKDLGVDIKNGYFNSGVFAVSRQTWKQISKEAYDYLVNNLDVCTHHDQSALNAVVGDRRLRLSCAWNFQTPYKYLNIEQKITPKIYHFSKPLKPWMGPIIPWQEIHPEYTKLVQQYREFNLPLKRVDEEMITRYNKRAEKKLIFGKMPLLPDITRSYMGFNRFEKQAVL